MSDHSYSAPLVVTGFGALDGTQPLSRIALTHLNGEAGYNERWIQELVHRHPNILPIKRIEPALTPILPVCTELPTPGGYIDNLLVTPDGGLVVVECKLWRNPEARRKVIGQVLDYAKDLTRWTYEELEAAICTARRSSDWSLWNAVAEHSELDEAAFCDAVSRNLRRGRILLLVVGDGIQEGAEQLADYLQRHVGVHFSLALVELALWRLPADVGILVQPRILLRTTTIERGVVTLDGGMTLVQPPARSGQAQASTLTEDLFYERLASLDLTLPAQLKAFLTTLESIGVTTEIKKNLLVRWRSPAGRAFRLAQVTPKGEVWTDNWPNGDDGSLAMRQSYLERLASLVPGAFVKKTPTPGNWYVATPKGTLTLTELLPHADGWRSAAEAFIADLGMAPWEEE